MEKENFDLLLESVEQMAAYVSGDGAPPARQTTYVGKVLTEIKVNGKTVWSLDASAAILAKEVARRKVASYPELIRLMMEVLGQTDEGLAQLMDVSVGTLRGWKSGRREPRGPSRKLLEIAAFNPAAVFGPSPTFSFAR
jgi:DNA-binding transcriptional regulator YiaG